MATFLPIFQGLLHKGVKMHIVIRDPSDHENEYFRYQATNAQMHYGENYFKYIDNLTILLQMYLI